MTPDLRAGSLPTWILTHMVELTSSAPRVQPIIHIKEYLHDSQLSTDELWVASY